MAVSTAAAVMAGANAIGGLYSANQQSQAAKRSAQAATSASDQNIAEQRRQYDQTRQDQMPFLQSDYARRSMADRTYGIQSQDMMGRQSVFDGNQGGMFQGNQGGIDYGSYVRNNPDLMDAYNASGGQYGGMEDFGAIHYQTHGRGEGRPLPMFGAQQQPQMAMQQGQAAGQPFDPLADFNRSADRALLNYEPAINSVNAAFSAKGQGLDSSASNAMAKSLTGLTQNAFYNFRSGLEGNPTGAVSALSAAGQNMANQNANQRTNTANALASSYGQRADANSGAAGSVIGSGYWLGNQAGLFDPKKSQSRGGVYGPSM